MPVFQFNPPERFIAGTVGPPGERTFFLQAVGEGRITSVVLEKAQVEALATRIEELLEEVQRRFGAPPDDVAPPEDDGLQRARRLAVAPRARRARMPDSTGPNRPTLCCPGGTPRARVLFPPVFPLSKP